ncbi:MAG: hypothetical protein ACTSV3_04980 [Candidatus Thorarchaeota archaeon]|nr:MAG: hypothetical protein DRP09_14270 [Candidatus Thorarchaeota archaeon]RLI59922.1 MAG: hypothetical protein DRO87_01505 [Candidatus Thorarchaeota archaeon]
MHVRKYGIALMALVALSVLVPLTSAQPRLATVDYIQIIDAYYADLDGDGYEDDIKLLVQFSLGTTEPSRIDINIWIELPSGIKYSMRVSVYRAPSDSILNIDCFDMATESGWYTVTMLASIMGTGNGKVYLTDNIVFDPPTGTGPGLPPSVDAYF